MSPTSLPHRSGSICIHSFSYTLFSSWLNPLHAPLSPSPFTLHVTVSFFSFLPRQARDLNQLPVKTLPRPGSWTCFVLVCPRPIALFETRLHILWLSPASVPLVKTLGSCEVQMVHSPPSECLLFSLYAIVLCALAPDTRSAREAVLHQKYRQAALVRCSISIN